MSDARPAAYFTTTAMGDVFSTRTHVRYMLRFEASLARAEARAGLIPTAAADAIAAACERDDFDVDAIVTESALAGTPAIPLVRMLTERVPAGARGWVHWGATSQDAVDTATALQMRDGLDILIGDLRLVGSHAASLADAHRRTVMPGRTLLQHASPITFGLKAARWLALVTRQIDALLALRASAVALQLGGAVGTLAVFGDKGLLVAEMLAKELALPAPDLPWHAERDRVARVAATLGIVAGAMSKIAGDVVLLAQSEVGEVSESAAAGKGGSSAMPQKRNPVDAVAALAAARLAAGSASVFLSGTTHEHERAAGAWQAEWVALPQLFLHTAAAVSHSARALDGLEVHVERMRANVELGSGTLLSESLSTALAERMGRVDAQELVKQVSARALRDRVTLRAAALDDERVTAALSAADIDRALDPEQYLGSSTALIDRALASFRRLS